MALNGGGERLNSLANFGLAELSSLFTRARNHMDVTRIVERRGLALVLALHVCASAPAMAVEPKPTPSRSSAATEGSNMIVLFWLLRVCDPTLGHAHVKLEGISPDVHLRTEPPTCYGLR